MKDNCRPMGPNCGQPNTKPETATSGEVEDVQPSKRPGASKPGCED